MSDEITMTREAMEALHARIDELEKKLAAKETKKKKKRKKDDDDETWSDSIGDAIDKSSRETGRILKGMVDATAEALSETADALSSLSEDTDKEKLGEYPAALISLFRRGLKIQRKALDKFEESCGKKKDAD
jgi:hypothetical protein